MNDSFLKAGSFTLLTFLVAEPTAGLVHALKNYYPCVPRISAPYASCVPQPKFPSGEVHIEMSSTFSSSGPGFVIAGFPEYMAAFAVARVLPHADETIPTARWLFKS